MKFSRYPKYMNSGVEWLGEVPAHWNVTPLKHTFRVIGGSTPKSDNEAFWDGEIAWVTPADLSRLSSWEIRSSQRAITESGLASCGTTLVPSGSIIISTRAPIGSLGIAAVDLCTNQGCRALVPVADQSTRFATYVLSIATPELNIRGKGTTFLELSGDELGAFAVPFPPDDEQSVIAALLDRETGKIDALVAEQEKLIALLKEKRQALISHAVTKGLNPDAPMKPSGIDWLGDVPAHWATLTLRRIVTDIEQGWSPECESRAAESGEWGVLKAGCVNGGRFDPSENKALPASLNPRQNFEVHNGDVLMSRASGSPKLIGSVAHIINPPAQLMLSDKIFRLNLTHKVMPAFFAALMGSTHLRGQIEQAIGGADGLANNLPQASIMDFWLLVPPLAEQQAIVAHIDAGLHNLESLQAEANRAITLLKERRAALISAAVTGKIDVRDAAAA